ncbi:hypothetical protein [Streptomyces variegatus]
MASSDQSVNCRAPPPACGMLQSTPWTSAISAWPLPLVVTEPPVIAR